MLERSRVVERSRALERQRGATVASLILTTHYTRSPTANIGDELVTNSPVTNPNVTPRKGADRTSAITPQSPETDANVTLENVTPIDGILTRNGLPVLDEAPSYTDAGEPAEPSRRLVNKYLTLPVIPTAVDGLIERGFLADDRRDDDTAILKALFAMLNAAWRAGVRAETAESASADA
jgi:hypothetical protein